MNRLKLWQWSTRSLGMWGYCCFLLGFSLLLIVPHTEGLLQRFVVWLAIITLLFASGAWSVGILRRNSEI